MEFVPVPALIACIYKSFSEARSWCHSRSSKRYWMELHHTRKCSSTVPQPKAASLHLGVGTVTIDLYAAFPEHPVPLVSAFIWGLYKLYEQWVEFKVGELGILWLFFSIIIFVPFPVPVYVSSNNYVFTCNDFVGVNCLISVMKKPPSMECNYFNSAPVIKSFQVSFEEKRSLVIDWL